MNNCPIVSDVGHTILMISFKAKDYIESKVFGTMLPSSFSLINPRSNLVSQTLCNTII